MQPLHCAASLGHLAIVRFLLQTGDKSINIDIDARDYTQSTALHKAADAGHNEVVTFLLSKGANQHIKSQNGETAAKLASNKKHTEVVATFNKANIDQIKFFLDAQQGNIEGLTKFITDGMNIFTQSAKGQTAFDFACENNHKEAARILT
ncbi:MAG UNVERIFIED_CONTAM: ankyrin repeat domain-containing protein [Rickettsiaceae bacterium]